MKTIDYSPAPTVKEFIKDYRPGELFYNWIVGPVGSGKTSGIFFKLIYMARLQAPGKDGIRRSRAVVVRNTAPQLRDTTLASWNLWFKDGETGKWEATNKVFTLRLGDVVCEVLFRPLDTPDDVARVLSLEVTFVLIDEFVQIPRAIIDALSARCGRYPPEMEGGATNFGMWGASNPDTEDNWWFEYLHNNLPSNAKYFVQPSGLSPQAENISKLPGKENYYKNQIIGKSEAWIKQFVEAEWGFSVAGKAVVASFKADLHISKTPLKFNPLLPLVVGFDPGLAGSAFIFVQLGPNGRLYVLGELIQQGMGAVRLISERLQPYLRNRFPGANVIIAPDPAANNRTPTDERTVVQAFAKKFVVKVETNNRLPLRLDAIEHFTTLLLEEGPALQIDAKECPILVRALKGGWRWAADVKKETLKGSEPEDNAYTHPGDAFGYACRYVYKKSDRESRYSGEGGVKAFVPPRDWGAKSYHLR